VLKKYTYMLGEHSGRSLVSPESRRITTAIGEELVAALEADAIELGSCTVHRPKKRQELAKPLPAQDTNLKV
jgi:hypothetical protein